MVMVASAPDGSGFPIGLMPGALPSDHASRQTLKTTAVRLPLGQSQFTGLVMPRHAPRFPRARHISCCRAGKGASKYHAAWAASHAPLPTLSDLAALTAWARSRKAGASLISCGRRLCPPYRFMLGTRRERDISLDLTSDARLYPRRIDRNGHCPSGRGAALVRGRAADPEAQ